MKDYTIWGSILGSPYFGKLPYIFWKGTYAMIIHCGARGIPEGSHIESKEKRGLLLKAKRTS